MRAVERIASDLAIVAGVMLQHTLPRYAGRIKQAPAVAEAMRVNVDQQLAVLEEHLGDKPFLVTDGPSIADITLFSFTQAFRVRMNTNLTEGYPRLSNWYDRFAKRPSAAASPGSSLPATVAPQPCVIRRNRTSGVLPMHRVMSSRMPLRPFSTVVAMTVPLGS